MGESNNIEEVFTRLGRWRHLPAYKLEPRADIFFALYLREVIERHTKRTLSEIVIPEFPLRRGTLWGEASKAPNMSVKVDYALFSADSTEVYFVELKTDMSSRRKQQDRYLKVAVQAGFDAIIGGILLIAAKSSEKRKYVHLLHLLAQLGFIEDPGRLISIAFPKGKRGITAGLISLRNLVRRPPPSISVIYVQPLDDDSHDVVLFDEFASVVDEHNDPMSKAFADALRDWKVPAGSIPP